MQETHKNERWSYTRIGSELSHTTSHNHTCTGQHVGKERHEMTEWEERVTRRPPPTHPYGHIERGLQYVSLCFSSAEQQNSKQRTPPRFSQTARGSVRFRHQLELLHSSFCLLFPVFSFAFLQGKFRWWGTRLQNKRYSQLAPKTCVWMLRTEVEVPCLHFCSGQDPPSSATPTASHSSQPQRRNLTSAKAGAPWGRGREREREEKR